MQEVAFDHAGDDRDEAIAHASPTLPGTTIRFEDQSTPQLQRRSTTVNSLPQLSSQVTIGRNSAFYNLTADDRERLGGIEYRSLKLLLKIVASTSD